MTHSLNPLNLSFETLCVRSAYSPEADQNGCMVPAINLASTFVQKTPGLSINGFEYQRTGNPSRAIFEKTVASIENCKYGLAFATGTAALANVCALLPSGSHMLCSDDVYGGTNVFLNTVLKPKSGIEIEMIDMTKPVNISKAMKKNTKLVWLETPTNPMLKCLDIAAIANEAHKQKDVIVVVDNTFASPYLQTPIILGADITFHSVTKYINGHSDLVMGWIGTNNETLFKDLAHLQNSIGGVPSPFDCYMATRGCKTLPLRMEKTCENAIKIANFLEKHPKVEKVIYPGLKSHPQHDVATKQMKNYGGIISFLLKGDLEDSRKFLSALKLWSLAESLGAVESLIESPAIMTHASVPIAQRKELGILDNLNRLSVGIENPEELINDLKKALG